MATHRISILQAVQPDNTSRCWLEPYDVFATNDVWKHAIIRMANPAAGQTGGFYGLFEVPQNYVGSASVKINWTTSAITGNACFRFTYRSVAGDNTTSLDQTSQTEQVSVTDAAPGAAHRKMDAAFTVTAGNFAAGSLIEYLLERFDNSAADTIAADVVLHQASFEYADV
jgi:hypothetical protein